MKIRFEAVCRVPDEDLERNRLHAISLGLPLVEAGASLLAVVGGGDSIRDHVQTLSRWPGDIWAINGAWGWARDNGIDAAFYSVDAQPHIAELARGAKRAVLSQRCDRGVFEALQEASLISHDTYGPTSASTAPIHAIRAGYREVHFFGCEGSYSGTSHAYKDIAGQRTLLKAACNGEEFMTSPQMVMQTEFLGGQIRAAPNVLKEASGGLLSAYIASPEIDIAAGPRRWVDEKAEA